MTTVLDIEEENRTKNEIRLKFITWIIFFVQVILMMKKTQNHLIFHSVFNNFTTTTDDYIVLEWKSKRFSKIIIKPSATLDNGFAARLVFINIAKI